MRLVGPRSAVATVPQPANSHSGAGLGGEWICSWCLPTERRGGERRGEERKGEGKPPSRSDGPSQTLTRSPPPSPGTGKGI